MEPEQRITNIHPADADHQVVTIRGGKSRWRRRPCPGCPWRRDATGVFPAEAFRHSANTAHDISDVKFACHQSGKDKPATCAGFLLRGADHNLAVRLARADGRMTDVDDGGHALFDDYTEMAIANGVDPDDDALGKCRRRQRGQ